MYVRITAILYRVKNKIKVLHFKHDWLKNLKWKTKKLTNIK